MPGLRELTFGVFRGDRKGCYGDGVVRKEKKASLLEIRLFRSVRGHGNVQEP